MNKLRKDELFVDVKDVKNLPENAGVYKFFDENRELIYIGKAKNLKKRVSSYFVNDKMKSIKTLRLVENIKYISFVVVKNENDAFLLEDNLIKENKPKYNILLKDSKTYPYLAITNEKFPRITVVERINNNDDYMYVFGPFSDRGMIYDILEFVRKFCKIRTCKRNIDCESLKSGKYKVCLEYHIGNCCGVCQNIVSESEYNKMVLMAVEILKGKLGTVKKIIKNKMIEYAKIEDYKMAQKYKEKLESLDNYKSKSVISSTKLMDLDILYLERSENDLIFCYIILSGGKIIFIKKDIVEGFYV